MTRLLLLVSLFLSLLGSDTFFTFACALEVTPGKARCQLLLDSLPPLTFCDDPLIIRLGVTGSEQPPKKEENRNEWKVPVVVSLQAFHSENQDPSGEVVSVPLQLSLYSDQRSRSTLMLPDRVWSQIDSLVIKLTDDKEVSEVRVPSLAIQKSGGSLHCNGSALFDRDGNRVVLHMPRWDESVYRRWSVYFSLQRRFLTPASAAVVVVSAEKSRSGESSWIDLIDKSMIREGRQLILIPGSDQMESTGTGVPILRLLAGLASTPARTDADIGAVLIAPGVDDLLFGTPLPLYRNGLHGIISRLEVTYPRKKVDLVLVIPAIGPGLKDQSALYLDIFREVAEARHLTLLDFSKTLPVHSWGQGGEFLYPDEVGQAALSKVILRETDFEWNFQVGIVVLSCLGISILVFVYFQWRTHRRLTRLVAISCAE